MRVLRALFGASLVALTASVGAQAPPVPGDRPPLLPRDRVGAPVRDNARSTPGTGKVTGRVLAADTGSPVRRAQIQLTSVEGRVSRGAVSDNEGRYEIPSLPAGRYRLYVSRAGFVQLEYGQSRPNEAGKLLDIADGQTIGKVDFSLSRGSAITGRITDEFGDPVTDAQVQALQFQLTNGERNLVNAGRPARTDDLGQFRIFGLMPGDYVVQALLRDASFGSNGTTEDRIGYPGTYYPGVNDASQAQTITVSLGQELSSISFQLMPARLSRVSGTVMSSSGQPLLNAGVVLRAVGPGSVGMRSVINGTAPQPDGRFSLQNVAPGEYMLEVQQRPRNLRNGQDAASAELEFASMPISVSGDIDNLVLTTSPGVTVTGRVVFLGQTADRAATRGMRIISVGSPGATRNRFGGRMGGGQVNIDRTFLLRGLTGPQLIRPDGMPSGWALRSVVMDGVDITDVPHDFKSGVDVTEVVVTLTDQMSQLSGGVRDARGQPVADYVLVVFPENERFWGTGSRHVVMARPDQNGNFSIKGLPAARYLAAAVASLDSGQDPLTLFAQLKPKAQSFVLAEGQQLTASFELAVP